MKILDIQDVDMIISILQYFNWKKEKVAEDYLCGDQEQLKVKMGIAYDQTLNKKYPEIVERLKEHNQNLCNVMYMEFDPNDEDMRADSLVCGHEFSAICWKGHLKRMVKDEG